MPPRKKTPDNDPVDDIVAGDVKPRGGRPVVSQATMWTHNVVFKDVENGGRFWTLGRISQYLNLNGVQLTRLRIIARRSLRIPHTVDGELVFKQFQKNDKKKIPFEYKLDYPRYYNHPWEDVAPRMQDLLDHALLHPEIAELFDPQGVHAKGARMVPNQFFNTPEADPDEPEEICALPRRLRERVLTYLLMYDHGKMSANSAATPWEEDQEPRRLHLIPKVRAAPDQGSRNASPEDVQAVEYVKYDFASKKRRAGSTPGPSPRKSPKKADPPPQKDKSFEMVVFKFVRRADSMAAPKEERGKRPLNHPFCRFVNELLKEGKSMRELDDVQEFDIAEVWTAIYNQWFDFDKDNSYLWFEYSADSAETNRKRAIPITSGRELGRALLLASGLQTSPFDGVLEVYCSPGRPGSSMQNARWPDHVRNRYPATQLQLRGPREL